MSDDKEKQQEAPVAAKEKDTELSDDELDSVVGGVPGYWDYDDPTSHS